jgi:hypothetical protein
VSSYDEDIENWYEPDEDEDEEEEELLNSDLILRAANELSSSLNIFVFKDDVLKTWGNPLSDRADKRQRAVNLEENSGEVSKPVIERAIASKAEIRKTAGEIYDEAERVGAKPPNITEAFRLIAERLAPKLAPKSIVFPILRENEFKNRRWDPGQRSSKK